MVKSTKRKYFSPKAKEEFLNRNPIVVTASGVQISPVSDKSGERTIKTAPDEPVSFDNLNEKLNDTKGSDQANYDRAKVVDESNPYNVGPITAATSTPRSKTPSVSTTKFDRQVIQFDSLYLTSCSGVLLEVAICISIIICILTAIPNICGKQEKEQVTRKGNNFKWLFTHRQSSECYFADIYFIYNITSIIIQILLLSFYTFHVIEYTPWIQWLAVEVIFYFFLILGHLIIGSFCIAKSTGTVFAAGVLGIFLAFICMMQFGSKFHKCRKGHYAQQGEGDPDNEDVRLLEGKKRFRISRQTANRSHSPGRFWKL